MPAEVVRPARVKVRWLDQSGTKREQEADDLLATCMQHEIDHLNGILFLKHLSPLKRDLIRRKISKLVKAGEW